MSSTYGKEIYWIGKDFDTIKDEFKESYNCEIVIDVKEFFNKINKFATEDSFKLIFCIINIDLFEEFTKLYKEYIKNKCILIYSIIFSENIYEDINKQYINDPFYNPGGITDDVQIIINNIGREQNRYYNLDNNYFNIECIDLFEHHAGKFGEMNFETIEEEREIILPLMWNKIVNMKIDGKNLANLQKQLVYSHKAEKKYIYPARDKIIKISDDILSKYFLYLYTCENNDKNKLFYSTLNRLLSHDDGFKIYHEYINIFYCSLKNKTFETFREDILYRGTKISKADFENLNRIYKENKENKKIFFYSKSFLSFSHNNKKADYFLNKDKYTCPPYLLLCKFILHESEKINNKWPSAFNIDVKSNSKFGNEEEEVLFLPMSCFLVEKIIEQSYYKELHLKYLDEYTEILDQKLNRFKQNNKDKIDFQTAFSTNFGKDIQLLYKNILNDYKDYFQDMYSININPLFQEKKEANIPKKNLIIVHFDPSFELKSILKEEKPTMINKVIYNVVKEDLDKNGYVNILGENKYGDDFVKLNKDKVQLEINGKTVDLDYKFKLNLGTNEIGFIFNNNNKIENFSYLFFNVKSLVDISALSKWDMSHAVNLNNLFSGCEKLSDISPLRNWNTSKVKNFSCLFSNCVSLSDLTPLKNWQVNNGIFFSYMFYNCRSILSLKGLKNWDVSNSKFFNCSFAYCINLKDIKALENWNLSKTEFFSHIFFECSNLVDIRPLEKWDVTSGRFFDYMFYGCSELSDITPLKKWEVCKATNFSYAFCKCNKLFDISALNNWNINSDCYLKAMFKECKTVEKTRPNWYFRTLIDLS